jgi:hypothetical protein
MGGLSALFTITISIRIARYSIPDDLIQSHQDFHGGVVLNPALGRNRFQFPLARYTTGDLSPAYLVQACSFLFAFVFGMGHDYAYELVRAVLRYHGRYSSAS